MLGSAIVRVRRRKTSCPGGDKNPEHQSEVPEECVDHARLPLPYQVAKKGGQKWG
jgi:hypothetical protein